MDELLRRISDRKAKVAVVGLGYVGLPLSVEIARAGFEVTGVDVDQSRVERICRGINYIPDVDDQVLQGLVREGRLRATTTYEGVSKHDAVVICVPTPLNKHKEPDISHIMAAAEEVRDRVHKGMLVILESTTYPGTTEELILPMMESTGMKAGQDFFLAFSPERVDPGNRRWKISNTPKVMGGVTQNCTKVAVALYSKFIEAGVVPVSSPRTAEMIKLLENTFRAVNIALVNEVAIMCDKLGVDTWEVIEGASTKPFGFMPFYPGPGLGGHCIPVDPHYLSWKLKSLNYHARFIELAGQINSSMPEFVLEKVIDALNEQCRSVKGSRVLLLGVAYKRDVSDLRESPALEIAEGLLKRGAELLYHDPYVEEVQLGGQPFRSQPLDEALLKDVQCVVILTDHSGIDYGWVVEQARSVVDTRGVTRAIRSPRVRRI